MRTSILLLLFFVSSASQAAGVNDASNFYKSKGSKELFFYLHGIFAGYGVANAQNEISGRPKLYCQPKTLDQVAIDLVSLVGSQIPIAQETYKNGLSGLPVEFVLLDALQRSFPCNNGLPRATL